MARMSGVRTIESHIIESGHPCGIENTRVYSFPMAPPPPTQLTTLREVTNAYHARRMHVGACSTAATWNTTSLLSWSKHLKMSTLMELACRPACLHSSSAYPSCHAASLAAMPGVPPKVSMSAH
eukprot:15454101-Alexandrium_andersonii.AAC.4